MEEIYLLVIFLLKKCTVFRVTRSRLGSSKDPDVNTSLSSVNVYSRQLLAPSCAAITVPEKESYCTIAPHLKFAALIACTSSYLFSRERSERRLQTCYFTGIAESMLASHSMSSSDGSDDSIFVFDRDADVKKFRTDWSRSPSPPSEVESDGHEKVQEKDQEKAPEVYVKRVKVSATVIHQMHVTIVCYISAKLQPSECRSGGVSTISYLVTNRRSLRIVPTRTSRA